MKSDQTDYSSSSFTESDFRKLDDTVNIKFKNAHEIKTNSSIECN